LIAATIFCTRKDDFRYGYGTKMVCRYLGVNILGRRNYKQVPNPDFDRTLTLLTPSVGEILVFLSLTIRSSNAKMTICAPATPSTSNEEELLRHWKKWLLTSLGY